MSLHHTVASDMTVSRVLVDRCAFDHGVLARTVTQDHSVQWGTHTVTWPVAKYQGKTRSAAEPWLRAEIQALASIAEAARRGTISVFSSFELEAESWRGRGKPHGRRIDLWAGVDAGHVPPPLDRSRWTGALVGSKIASGEHQHAFVAELLMLANRQISEEWLLALEVPPHERQNLARLNELVAICNAVDEPRWVDAFHFWTALCNDIEYFLTTDRKLLNSLREKDLAPDIVCRAVSATELAEALSLPPSALPIGEGEIISCFDADT